MRERIFHHPHPHPHQFPPSISSPLSSAQDGGQEVSVGEKFQVVRILNLHRLPT